MLIQVFVNIELNLVSLVLFSMTFNAALFRSQGSLLRDITETCPLFPVTNTERDASRRTHTTEPSVTFLPLYLSHRYSSAVLCNCTWSSSALRPRAFKEQVGSRLVFMPTHRHTDTLHLRVHNCVTPKPPDKQKSKQSKFSSSINKGGHASATLPWIRPTIYLSPSPLF